LRPPHDLSTTLNKSTVPTMNLELPFCSLLADIRSPSALWSKVFFSSARSQRLSPHGSPILYGSSTPTAFTANLVFSNPRELSQLQANVCVLRGSTIIRVASAKRPAPNPQNTIIPAAGTSSLKVICSHTAPSQKRFLFQDPGLSATAALFSRIWALFSATAAQPSQLTLALLSLKTPVLSLQLFSSHANLVAAASTQILTTIRSPRSDTTMSGQRQINTEIYTANGDFIEHTAKWLQCFIL